MGQTTIENMLVLSIELTEIQGHCTLGRYFLGTFVEMTSGWPQISAFIGWTVRGNSKSRRPQVGKSWNVFVSTSREKNRKDVVECRGDVDWWKSWKALGKKKPQVVGREKRMWAAGRYKDVGMHKFLKDVFRRELWKFQLHCRFPSDNRSESISNLDS